MRLKVKVIFPPSSPCLHISTSFYYILVLLVLLFVCFLIKLFFYLFLCEMEILVAGAYNLKCTCPLS